MDGGTGVRRNSRKTIYYNFNGHKIMEIHDRLHPEGTRHIKKRTTLASRSHHLTAEIASC